MHPLPKAIHALFSNFPTARLRKALVREAGKLDWDQKDRRLLEACLREEFPQQINETLSHITTYLTQLACEPDAIGTPAKGLDPFRLLYRFADQHLQEDSSGPKVKYRRLLSWRFATRPLGEDLVSTAFLAVRDHSRHHERHFFAWPSTLSPHHPRLQKLFERGLAENHYHLYGSGPHVFLSWIHLMNFPVARWRDFQRRRCVSEDSPRCLCCAALYRVGL